MTEAAPGRDETKAGMQAGARHLRLTASSCGRRYLPGLSGGLQLQTPELKSSTVETQRETPLSASFNHTSTSGTVRLHYD